MKGGSEIGVIGVGLLGLAIVRRLAGVGWRVVGFDVDGGRRRLAEESGSRWAVSAGEVFAGGRPVILSLPSSGVARNVLAGVIGQIAPGQLVIDTTTGDPSEMMGMAELLAAGGGNYLEACVGGSSEQLLAGEAMLFLGGDEDALALAGPVMKALAGTSIVLGSVGAASRFKLVHNLVLGLHRAVLAEGLRFAEALGFEPARALEILADSPASSRVMKTKGARMVRSDYAPQARLSQHLKDVRLMLEEARRVGLELPLTRVHRQLLERAEEAGFGAADNAAVIEAYPRPRGGTP